MKGLGLNVLSVSNEGILLIRTRATQFGTRYMRRSLRQGAVRTHCRVRDGDADALLGAVKDRVKLAHEQVAQDPQRPARRWHGSQCWLGWPCVAGNICYVDTNN